MKKIRQVIVDGRGESKKCINIMHNSIDLFKKIASVEFQKPILFTPDFEYTSDKIKSIAIEKLSYDQYNHFLLDLVDYWPDDSYLMLCQPDGYPIIAENWMDEFLNYDYIGAPWQHSHFINRVGNGGFSIRSKKYLDACKILFDDFPMIAKYHNCEDFLCTNIYYHEMISLGITFAPLDLAAKFSYENPIAERLFGVDQCFGLHDFVNGPVHEKIKYRIE